MVGSPRLYFVGVIRLATERNSPENNLTKHFLKYGSKIKSSYCSGQMRLESRNTTHRAHPTPWSRGAGSRCRLAASLPDGGLTEVASGPISVSIESWGNVYDGVKPKIVIALVRY